MPRTAIRIISHLHLSNKQVFKHSLKMPGDTSEPASKKESCRIPLLRCRKRTYPSFLKSVPPISLMYTLNFFNITFKSLLNSRVHERKPLLLITIAPSLFYAFILCAMVLIILKWKISLLCNNYTLFLNIRFKEIYNANKSPFSSSSYICIKYITRRAIIWKPCSSSEQWSSRVYGKPPRKVTRSDTWTVSSRSLPAHSSRPGLVIVLVGKLF